MALQRRMAKLSGIGICFFLCAWFLHNLRSWISVDAWFWYCLRFSNFLCCWLTVWEFVRHWQALICGCWNSSPALINLYPWHWTFSPSFLVIGLSLEGNQLTLLMWEECLECLWTLGSEHGEPLQDVTFMSQFTKAILSVLCFILCPWRQLLPPLCHTPAVWSAHSSPVLTAMYLPEHSADTPWACCVITA